MKAMSKSRTQWAAAVIAALAVVELQAGTLTELFGTQAGAALALLAAVAMAVLRVLTTQPIGRDQ